MTDRAVSVVEIPKKAVRVVKRLRMYGEGWHYVADSYGRSWWVAIKSGDEQHKIATELHYDAADVIDALLDELAELRAYVASLPNGEVTNG